MLGTSRVPDTGSLQGNPVGAPAANSRVESVGERAGRCGAERPDEMRREDEPRAADNIRLIQPAKSDSWAKWPSCSGNGWSAAISVRGGRVLRQSERLCGLAGAQLPDRDRRHLLEFSLESE